MKKLLLTLFTILGLNSYSQLTYVPDDAFEAVLEGYYPACDNGNANDNYVLTAGMQQMFVFAPFVGWQTVVNSVADFTGIEDCINLNLFQLNGNNVVDSINLSSAKGVGPVHEDFILQISNCNNLHTLITPDTTCRILIQNNYNLTTISFNTNTEFREFILTDNYSLESLDLSNNKPALMINFPIQFSAANNDNLKCLNLKSGFCLNWMGVGFGGNPLLNCVQVDDPNYSQVSWSWNEHNTNPQDYSYSTNCNTNCTVGINEANIPSLSIYPNPSNTGLIQLNTSIVNSDINVYSIEGKQINFTQTPQSPNLF